MPTPDQSLTHSASTLGYSSEKEMLQDLYLTNGFGLRVIAEMVGMSTFALRRRLKMWGIKVRARGGANNFGNRRLKNVSDYVLFSYNPSSLAKVWKCNVSTVFAEKRYREAQREKESASCTKSK